MRTNLQIDGLPDITRRVNGFRQKLFDEMRAIALEAADMVRDEAIARAPVDTGELAGGIISDITWDHKTSKVFAGAGMDASKNGTFVRYSASGKRYYYPASIEYGHGDPKRGQRAFLRPALKAKKAAVRAHVASRVSALIARAGT